MAEEPLTLGALVRFHRDIVAPEFDRIVGRLDEHTGMHNETISHLDAIYKRFGNLESEYQPLSAAVARLETRASALDDKLDGGR